MIARLRVVARKRLMLGIIGQLVNAVLFGGIVGVLVWMLADGRTSLQDATVAAGAVLLLGQRMGQIVGGDVHEFLGAAVERRSSRPAAAPAEPLVELQVHDVWFRYPSSTQPALRGVEMAVRPGEVVALVGPNGSGKTTLAKVLAQLFEAERGSVTWNGIDVSSLDNAGLRDRVAVIFQDFEQYLFSAADNIGLGRVARLDDRDAIVAASQRAGADTALAHLPDGYDTLLGPEYWGGSDLSIGQWQRVAIARAFFRNAELLIFDEPSSALDAEAEAALFARLRELATGRAVVVISHRFSTVTTADRIYVMEDGSVTESGSHETLIAEAGTYARLFAIQAAQYLPGIAPESPEPPVPPGRAK